MCVYITICFGACSLLAAHCPCCVDLQFIHNSRAHNIATFILINSKVNNLFVLHFSEIISHPIRSELEAFIEESVNFGVVVFLDPPINVK